MVAGYLIVIVSAINGILDHTAAEHVSQTGQRHTNYTRQHTLSNGLHSTTKPCFEVFRFSERERHICMCVQVILARHRWRRRMTGGR